MFLKEHMDKFDIVNTASGEFALVLEATATWEEFSGHAEKWILRLNAKLLSKPVVTFDECIAEVAISGGEFWITYDDFQGGIQLEPKCPRLNDIVTRLQAELRHSAQ